MKYKFLIATIITVIMSATITTVVLSDSSKQEYQGQKWEYLEFQYSQSDMNFNDTREEFAVASDPFYTLAFGEQIDCFAVQFNDPNTPESQIEECYSKVEENFKGSIWYLNVLGDYGWELVSATNSSSEYEFRIEYVFKRSK